MRNGLTGAIADGYKFVLIAICLIIIPQPAVSEEILDYEKGQCGLEKIVNDIDVYRLQSYPRPNIQTGTDKCINTFITAPNKKLKIYIYEVSIASCGLFINIFDGDKQMQRDPRWSLGCRSPGKTILESYTNLVVVRLDKPVSDSTSLYQFRIYITNENGPEVDLSEPKMSDGGASSGVIAGIGIGVGLVVVVIIIVVAIVCWRMMSRKEKHANKSPAVFTTSETRGDSVRFENTLGGSRSRGTRASSDRSSTTNGYRSTSGSQRGRSSHHHDNNGYVSSNESSVMKISRNPIPIKAGDGAKFEIEKEVTTHRFTKRDGSVRRKINLDHDKEINQNPKNQRPKDEIDSARVVQIPKSKQNDNTHSLVRSSSEKRSSRLRSTTGSRVDTSSDTLSSQSDRRSRREDRQSRSQDYKYEERTKDSATRRSSYRESQSQDRRDRTGSTRSRTNSTSRSNRPSYRDDYDTGGQRDRYHRDSRRHQKNYDDYDSDHRSHRREKYDRNPGYDSDTRKRYREYDSDHGGRDRGYDSETRRRHHGYNSDTRRRHHGYDSDRGGRDRSQRRYDQSDRYSDYESDHGRRRDSSRRKRPQTDKYYRDYDSDDNNYRSSRHRQSQRSHRDKYHSDEDLVDRRQGGSMSRKSRPRSRSYSRDNRR